ncbi:MAG TPA: trimethylamine methyltransferase family protein [Thermoleophilia bacterium]|nr:trimethylamine methyltransferase family protein [Thermoleophilia bacterium]
MPRETRRATRTTERRRQRRAGETVAQARITYLSDDEKQFIHEKTLEVLAEVGIAYNTPAAIDLLEAAGARVDRETLKAWLTWDVIEPALRTVPRQVLLAGRDPSHDVVLGGDRLLCTSDGMTTYWYDDLTGERREGTTDDLALITRLSDALPEIDYIWPTIQAGDADGELMPLVMQATVVRNSVKHVQDEVRTPEMVGPILEIYEAACGAPLTERPYFSVTNCTIAPLQHDREMTEAGLLLCKRGVPIFVLPMPQVGTTGPGTVLSDCIVNMAELLSGIVLYQLAEPGCATISGVGAGVADMRTGGYIAAGPEIGLINMICIEMSRFYGLPTQATGMSSDAKAVNFQAGSEGGMTALVAALLGSDSLIAAGGLDGVQQSSLAKIVLDCDQIGALQRYCRAAPIDEAHALLDDIKEVGIGGHFLGARSTRRFARTEVWRPAVFQRGTFDEFKDRSLVEQAVERARAVVAAYEPPPLPDGADEHIDQVIKGYAASLT